ncbi:MAG TPA: amidohydrolase family protein [Streptosporangiaceae bacterium]|nr:amidohydrolase family protein [Streptosporangiaceae bacterium]
MSSDPLVDVHVHLYPDSGAGQQAKDRYVIWEYGDDPGVDFSPAAGDITDLMTVYGRAGFDRAVVVHLFDTALAREEAMARLAPRPAPGEPASGRPAAERADAAAAASRAAAEAMRASNRWVADMARAHPLIEVLISIDPAVLSPAEMTAHLAELADAGVRGVKLHPVSQGFSPADPRLHPIYDLCSEAGLIVLSHSGPGHRGGASARPGEFASVLKQWPQLHLVLAHLGGASWPETAEFADAFPQAAFDLSEIIEWAGAPNAPSAADLTGLIRHIGADRVMLGSDFPWYDPGGTADRVAGLPGLGAAERAAILGGTATRFFGLEASA